MAVLCPHATGLGEAISGCIMFEETLYQKAANGTQFVDVLKAQSIVPGIKVDTGASDGYAPCLCTTGYAVQSEADCNSGPPLRYPLANCIVRSCLHRHRAAVTERRSGDTVTLPV